MTPEARSLLQAISSKERAPFDRIGEPGRDFDWNRLLALAESHGVLPLLCASGIQLPDEFLIRSREKSALSLMLASELETLLGQFQEEGVQVIALKGPVLAHTLYGRVGLRPSDDLDLLVRPEDFGRAEARLLISGFDAAGPADNYHRDYFRDGVFVELHFAVSSPSAPFFDLKAAWDRSMEVQFRASPVKILSPIDRVIYLSLHGLKHRFARLIWVRDLYLALQALDSESRQSLLNTAGAQRVRNIVLAGAAIARWCFGTLAPEIEALLAEQPELVVMADRIAEEILAVEADPTTSVEDSRLYLTLADPGSRWLQRLRFFHPTDQDYRWAANHRINRRLMMLIRPFRIIGKYGLKSALRMLFPRR